MITCHLVSYAQFTNRTPHQFNPNDWSIVEYCTPCHINDVSQDSTLMNFPLSYESDSIKPYDNWDVSGISKLCFSCHDGTNAPYVHNKVANQTNTYDIKTTTFHPVSIEYVYSDSASIKLRNPFITLSGLGSTIAEDMLRNGKVECTSCHDPHFSQYDACKICPPNNSKERENSAYLSLRKSNMKSKLCLTCHKF